MAVANGGIAPRPNFVLREDEINASHSSGYYQFHLLSQFLENYASFRRTREGRDYRLVFSIYKDNQSFLVEPRQFRLSRTASSVLEYPYSLTLRAYGRVNLDTPVAPANEFKPAVLDANVMGQMLATLKAARQTIYAAQDVIRAVAADLDQLLFEPMRQMTLFVKEAVGSPLTLADIPASIVSGAKEAVLAYASIGAYGSQMVNQADKPEVFNKMFDDIVEIAKVTGTSKVRTASPPDTRTPKQRLSLYEQAASDKVNTLFTDHRRSYELFDSINPASLDLSEASVRAINDERARVVRMTRKDFEVIRDNLEKFLTNFEFSIGGGDPTVAAIYGIKVPNNELVEPNDEHFEVIFSLNRLVQEASKLAATRDTNRTNISAVEYVAGLATRSGLAFKVPVSKFAIPFPYGHSLEDLARQYLGTPDRWMEISQLNGLRTPYVDEEGFRKPLLVDGVANQITVENSTNLYLGQVVWVVSNTALKTKRRITGITNELTHSVIELDGDNDLGNYEYLAGAYLHGFLPGTVNSQMSIYIPSSVPIDDAVYQTKDIPGLEDADPLINAGGVGLLLDNNNDLVITPQGETRLAIGLQNVIQMVRIMLSVRKGTLNQHPDFGLPLEVGQSLSEISAKEIAKAVKDMFNSIPAWDCRDVTVEITGPSCRIGFNLMVPGTAQLIPVFFSVST